jgi:hypothetical protein
LNGFPNEFADCRAEYVPVRFRCRENCISVTVRIALQTTWRHRFFKNKNSRNDVRLRLRIWTNTTLDATTISARGLSKGTAEQFFRP